MGGRGSRQDETGEVFAKATRMVTTLKRIRSLHGAAAAVAQNLTANILILSVNLVTGIITARLLGPDGKGIQAAISLWPQFLAYSLTLGLPTALLYNLRRTPERGSRDFAAALVLGTVMGFLATLVGIVVIPRWLSEYPTEVVRLAQWTMLLAPLSLANFIFVHVLQAREEFHLYNAARYLQPVITLAALVSLAAIGWLTPLGAALCYVLPLIPIFLWLIIRLWKIYRPVWSDLGDSIRHLTSYGVRSYGAELLGPMTNQIDRVLVAGLLNPAALGLYVVAVSAARILNALQVAVVSVLFPRASGRGIEEVVAITGRGARMSTLLTLLAATTLALLGPYALGLVYGQEYVEAATVFRYLLLEVVLGGTAWVLAQAFMALDRPGTVSAMQSIGVGLSVVLMLVLVPRYGLVGASLALLIATTVRLIFIVLSFRLTLKVPAPGLWPRREDFATVLKNKFNKSDEEG